MSNFKNRELIVKMFALRREGEHEVLHLVVYPSLTRLRCVRIAAHFQLKFIKKSRRSHSPCVRIDVASIEKSKPGALR